MSDVPDHVRREAAILARRKKARVVQFSREAPIDWQPQTVINPQTGTVFTDAGAWEFIAEKLEDANQTARWVELRNPPGKKAIEIIVPHGGRNIYIKVQLGSGKIKVRSFHYSKTAGNRST